jgi:excisionase family DNA binding protein
MVTAEEAARLAGVSPRTVRRWIRSGQLPSVEGPDGRRVSPADLAALRRRPRPRPTADAATDTRGHGRPVTAATDTEVASVSSAARSQLEAIRDEWLAPLVAQIRAQAEQIGRLEERLATTERDRLALAQGRDRLAGQLATDRTLTDQLVGTLERERDAAVKAAEALREEFRAVQNQRSAPTTGQGEEIGANRDADHQSRAGRGLGRRRGVAHGDAVLPDTAERWAAGDIREGDHRDRADDGDAQPTNAEDAAPGASRDAQERAVGRQGGAIAPEPESGASTGSAPPKPAQRAWWRRLLGGDRA